MRPHDAQWAEALAAYAAGVADEGTRSLVDAHLDEGCRACASEIVGFAALGGAAGRRLATRAVRRRAWLVAVAAVLGGLFLLPRFAAEPGAPVRLEREDGTYVAFDLSDREVWRWSTTKRASATAPLLLSAGPGLPGAYIPLEDAATWEIVRIAEGRADTRFASRGPGRLRRLVAVPSDPPTLLLVTDAAHPAGRRSSLWRVDAADGTVRSRWDHAGLLVPHSEGEVDSIVVDVRDRGTLLLVGGRDEATGRACAHVLGLDLRPRGPAVLLPRIDASVAAAAKAVQTYEHAGARYAEIATNDGLRLRIGYSPEGWSRGFRVDFIDETAHLSDRRREFEADVEFR